MDTRARKVFIGGNWKSNNTVEKSRQLVENVINKLDFDNEKTGRYCDTLLEVLVAPINLHVQFVKSLITNST